MEVPLHQHWHDIHVRRWLVVLTAIAAGLIAYFGSLAMTPVYEAKTTFFLAANATPSSYSSDVPDAPHEPLFPIPEEKAASLDVGILRGPEMMGRLAEDVGVPRGDLERQVDITVSGEFMIDAFVRDPDPDVARDIANRIPVLYEDFHQTSVRDRAATVADALASEIATLTAEAEDLRTRRQTLRAQLISTADTSAVERLQAERDAALSTLRSVDSAIAQNEARLISLDDALNEESALYAAGQTTETTNAIDDMLQRILDLRVDLAAVTDGASSPRRQSIEGQIAEIEAAMQAERERLAEAAAKPQGSLFETLRLERALARAETAELMAQKAASQSTLASLDARFDTILSASATADVLTDRINRIELELASLESRASAARLQAENATVPIVIVGIAESPTRPAFPLPILNTIVAVICGTILGVYYAIFVAHSERGRLARIAADADLPIFAEEELVELRKSLGIVTFGGRKRESG